jgi:drug/metabolite transporter (DMT)-like permease
MTRELPRGAEVIGTLIATAGIALLAAFDYRFEPGRFSGDLVCLVSMLFYAVYLALARRNAPKEGIILYLVPLYLIGGLFCLLCALPFTDPIRGITANDLVMTLGLALGPTIVGHSLMNRSMTKLPPQTVSLFNLTQFIVAAVLGWLLFGEMAGPEFLAASALIAAGVAIPVLHKGRMPR